MNNNILEIFKFDVTKFLFVVSCCNADRENLEETSSNTSLAMDNKNCIVNTK